MVDDKLQDVTDLYREADASCEEELKYIRQRANFRPQDRITVIKGAKSMEDIVSELCNAVGALANKCGYLEAEIEKLKK